MAAECTPYQQRGGDQPLRQLAARVYEIILTAPGAAGVRDMHDADTGLIRETLFDFLSGWLGGPARYLEKHGHPRRRARHRFFAIGEREQWLRCISRALADTPMAAALRERLAQALFQTADFLRNRAEH